MQHLQLALNLGLPALFPVDSVRVHSAVVANGLMV